MSFFVLFLVNAALFVAAELLRPKPDLQDAEAVPYGEANFPQIDPTRKLPVVFGAVRLTAPHVADVTEYNTIPIKKKIKTGLFSSTRQTIGHNYYVGMQLVLCHGPVTLRKIYWDDEVIWSGTAGSNDAGVSIDINLPDLLGGKENGGGLVGRITFFSGSSTQNQSSYLSAFQPEGIAYRHSAYVVLENFGVGETPSLDPMAFEVEAYPNVLGLSGTDLQTGRDINPIAVAAEIFVNDDWGFGVDVGDLVSWGTQAATLKAEGNMMSLKLTQEAQLEKTLNVISKQVDGQHRYRPALNGWDYKLLRDDYTIGALPVYDSGKVIKYQNYKRVNWQELTNIVSVNFQNRDSKEKPSPAIAADRSLYDRLGGKNNSATQEYPGVYDKTLANKLASRALRKGAFPFAAVELTVDRSAYSLMPGDVIIWEEPELGIDQLVMRVMKISFGTPDQTEIVMSCVEDVFAQAAALFSNPPTSLYTPVAGAPVAAVVGRVEDQPFFLAQFDEDRTAVEGVEKPMFLLQQPQGNSLEYRAEQRQGTDPYTTEGNSPYTPVGTLQAAVNPRSSANINEFSTLIVENVTNVQALSEFASATDDEIRISGENYILIEHSTEENEILAYDSLTIAGTTVTLTGVHRGMIDTLAVDLEASARVWFLTAGMGTTDTEYGAADAVDYMFFNVATTGESGSALSRSNTFRNRTSRPYPPGYFQVNSIRWPTATFAINSAFNMSWRHRDRQLGTARYQDDASATALESGFEYLLNIYDDTGGSPALIRRIRPSGSGNTPAGDDVFDFNNGTGSGYNYTLAKQQADAGPVSKYFVELWVEESVTGAAVVKSLVAVERLFTVVIPVNFNRRGPPYSAAINTSPGLMYPLTEPSGNFDAVAGGSGAATIAGSIGRLAPGPKPLQRAIVIPGHNIGGGWVGNITVPDNSELDESTSVGAWTKKFWIKVVRDGQANPRVIAIHDDANAVPVLGSRFAITATGQMQYAWQGSAVTEVITGYSARHLEDGRWHSVALMYDTGEFGVIIDGRSPWTGTPSSAVGGTANFSIGGFSGISSYGYAKMFFSLFSSSRSWESLAGVIRGMIQNQPWSPWVTLGPKFFDWSWARGLGKPSGQGYQIFDWSTAERNASAGSFTPNLNNKTTPLNAMKMGNSGAWDSGYEVSPITDGGINFAADYGGNGFQLGNDFWPAKNVQGPQSYGAYNLIHIDSFGAYIIRLWTFEAVNLGSEVTNSELYSAWVDQSGFVRISIQPGGGNYRVHRTTAQCVFPGEWSEIWTINRPSTGWEVWVNGVQYAMNNAYATGGTPPATDVFLNYRQNGGSINNSLYHNLHNQRASSATAIGAIAADDYPGFGAEHGETTDPPLEDDIRIFYAAKSKGFQSLLDVLLDFNPENVFQIEDNTAADLRGNIITPTPNGTFTTDEEVPLGADDSSKPQRFDASATNRLDYTSDHLLSSKGTGLVDNFSLVIIGQNMDASINTTIFSNTNVGASDEQMRLRHSAGAEVRFFQTGMSADVIGPTPANMQPFCYVLTHQDDAGTDRWNWWADGKKAVSEVTTPANAYTGGAVDRFKIGARADNTQYYEGNIHYIAAFARTVAPRIARRINLRYLGFTGAMLEIHSEIDKDASLRGWLFPLCEIDQSASGAENWIVNDALIQNLTLTNAHTSVRAGIPTNGLPRSSSYASGSFVEGIYQGGTGYPLTFGGWFKVDSGTSAMVAISDRDQTDNAIAVGIVGGFATIRTYLNGSAVDEQGSIAITVGDWAFIVATIVSDTERNLYTNGVPDGVFTTSKNVDGLVLAVADTLSVNRIIGPNVDFVGSYQLFFGMSVDFDDARHARLYKQTQLFAWEALTNRDGPIAQWLLDEPTAFVTQVYRDQYNPDYSAAPSAAGVTQQVAGILPSAPGLCVDITGADGGIATGFTGYVTGSAVRGFECWIEAGYVGTVLGMGANTDAQALVISIDGSGDLTINIRGTGNARTWTATLDTGTEHHLFIQLNGDSLHDFEVYVDGVEETTIGTAGTDTVLATTATLGLFIGEDPTDIATADGNGKIYGVTLYDNTNLPLSANEVEIRDAVGRSRISGLS